MVRIGAPLQTGQSRETLARAGNSFPRRKKSNRKGTPRGLPRGERKPSDDCPEFLKSFRRGEKGLFFGSLNPLLLGPVQKKWVQEVWPAILQPRNKPICFSALRRVCGAESFTYVLQKDL